MKKLALLSFVILISCKKDDVAPKVPTYCYDSVYAAGDSFTANIGFDYVSYPSYLQALIDRPVINGGISGEISTQIAERYLKHGSKGNLPVIIWAGANNNWETEIVKRDIRRMVGKNKRFLILEVMNGSHPERWRGTPYYENNLKLNKDIASEYGENHFVWIKTELQKYMVNQQDSIDVFEHDAVPTSLRSDWLHHNNLANQKIAALLAERLKCNR